MPSRSHPGNEGGERRGDGSHGDRGHPGLNLPPGGQKRL